MLPRPGVDGESREDGSETNGWVDEAASELEGTAAFAPAAVTSRAS